jgi:putative DNA methylase
MTDTNSTLCSWQVDPPRLRATFGRQGLAMTWDFAEANIFADAAGDYQRCVGSLSEVPDRLYLAGSGVVEQQDAMNSASISVNSMISTDPPYYNNIGYADLSDYFYVWLKRSLINTSNSALFETLLVPKHQELVATPFRFGGDKDKAKQFFEVGIGCAFEKMRRSQNSNFPMTVYYAFKQSESDPESEESGISVHASTGWETMLEGLLRAEFQVTGTWPLRSELSSRSVGRGANALASSIVLACRPRPDSAPIISPPARTSSPHSRKNSLTHCGTCKG